MSEEKERPLSRHDQAMLANRIARMVPRRLTRQELADFKAAWERLWLGPASGEVKVLPSGETNEPT